MEWVALVSAVMGLLGAVLGFLKKRAREREHDSTALVDRDRTVLRRILDKYRVRGK